MMRFTWLRFIGLILVSIVISLTLRVPVAYTAGVVNPCTEANLDTALTTGGIVTFACSGTILITTTKIIAIDTTIDGSGQSVVIAGDLGIGVQLFTVNSGVTLQMNTLTLRDGDATSAGLGGALYNSGTAVITNVTFSNNGAGPGANAGAIANGGTMSISNSTFVSNFTAGGGGAINNSGTLTISNSTFTNNRAPYGGAITNAGNGVLTITNSTFSNNNGGVEGGAIQNTGFSSSVTIINSNFSDNVSSNGASIFNSTSLTATGSFFINGSCVGVIGDGGNNGKSNAPGCPGTEGLLPVPDQCQEMLDPTFSAPVGWYCQVLMRDNTWTGISGSIPAELIDAGVIIAIDVTYYDFAGHASQEGDSAHQVCLQGNGRFIFLSSAQAPRQIVEVNSISEGGYTCAWVTTAGTAVLIRG